MERTGGKRAPAQESCSFLQRPAHYGQWNCRAALPQCATHFDWTGKGFARGSIQQPISPESSSLARRIGHSQSQSLAVKRRTTCTELIPDVSGGGEKSSFRCGVTYVLNACGLRDNISIACRAASASKYCSTACTIHYSITLVLSTSNDCCIVNFVLNIDALSPRA